MNMKKMIKGSLGVDWDGVNATYIIEVLQGMMTKYSDVCVEYDYYGYDGQYDVKIAYEREETDQEYEDRTKKEKAQLESKKKEKILKDQRERKEYERLKAKFGG